VAGETPGWWRLVLFGGATLTAVATGWYVTWGSIVASTDPPQSRPFWIGVTWFATAGLTLGLGLVALGELGPLRHRRRVGESVDERGANEQISAGPSSALLGITDAALQQGRELIHPFMARDYWNGAEAQQFNDDARGWLTASHSELRGIDQSAADHFGSPDPGDTEMWGVVRWREFVMERIDRLNRLRDRR